MTKANDAFCGSEIFFEFCTGMNRKIIVTIDGLSSCGKSTLARQLAAELGYLYIDSGAMYRAVTLYFLRNNINFGNPNQVKNAIKDINLHFELNPFNQQSEIYLNGENVEYIIRDLLIAEKVSDVAAIKEVREFAVSEQQKLGRNKAIVMDGRDIGTTVFPNAEVKIFMIADEAVRVERRYTEMYDKNPNITIDEVKANIAMRDYIDSNREVSPLRKADDAVVLDNTNLTQKEQLKYALELVKKQLQPA